MNIKFVLTVFGWRLGSFDISIDMGEGETIVPVGVATRPTVIDKVSDYFATRYIERRLTKNQKNQRKEMQIA